MTEKKRIKGPARPETLVQIKKRIKAEDRARHMAGSPEPEEPPMLPSASEPLDVEPAKPAAKKPVVKK